MSEPVAFRGIRKVIADRMMQSLKATAQLTYHASADVTSIMNALPSWKANERKAGLQDCVLHALSGALQRHGLLNATCDEGSYTISEQVRISLALSSPVGLVTPVLPPLMGLSIEEISQVRREIVARAMEGSLKVGDFKGGTFTLSNLGLTSVEYFTPIINAPQVAILGIGTLMQVVSVDEAGRPVLCRKLPLSLTADHRVVDGDPAGQFLSNLVRTLQSNGWSEA